MSHERPGTSRESVEQQTVREYFTHLGLTVEDVRGKKLLDIGSGDGAFVRFANAHGADAIAFDNGNTIYEDGWKHIEGTGTPFVVGDAGTLPFADGTFQLVISHAALPSIANPVFADQTNREDWATEIRKEQERRIASLQEMLRVVAVDGEIRCAPVVNDTEDYVNQTNLIREAIAAVAPIAEIAEEPLSKTTFRLILKKKIAVDHKGA